METHDGARMTKKIATLLCILLIGPLLMASTPVNGMTAEQKAKAKEELFKKISGTLATTFQTNLYEFKDEANKTFNNVTSGSLNFRSDYGFTLSTFLAVNKDLRNERNQSVRDPVLRVSVPVYGSKDADVDIQRLRDANTRKKSEKIKKVRKQRAKKAKKAKGKKSKDKIAKITKVEKEEKKAAAPGGSVLNVAMRASFTLPWSDRSKKETSLRTAVSISPLVVYIFDPQVIPGLSLIATPSVRVFTHEFRVDTAGNSNTNYSAAARFIVSYVLAPSLSLSLDNSYARAWTYEGEYNDQFSFDQSLSYVLAKGFSIYVGHAVGGSALDVNGQESNLKLFDSRESQIYGGVSYAF